MSSPLRPTSSAPASPGHPDALQEEAVALLLPPEARRAFDVRVIDETGSTNSDLLRDAAQLPSGTVLAAGHQTAGRGRRGRAWVAPPGGSLAFSLLWKFTRGAAMLSGLSLAVGVAAARALEKCGAPGVQLKWPNDLLAPKNGAPAKLGGILIELTGGTGGAGGNSGSSGHSGAALVVIGIGINLDLGGAAAGIDQPVTDLAALGVRTSRNALLALLLETLLPVLRTFERDGFAPLADEWNRRHGFANQAVVLSGENTATLEGIAIGADASGALLLETAQGIEKIVSGEVSSRPVLVISSRGTASRPN